MDSLLNHPAIQSGIIPFVVALPIILILGKIQPKLIGLAVIAAFTVTVGMVMGFGLTPFTSTKKVISIAYATLILGFTVDVAGEKWEVYRTHIHSVAALLAAAGFFWVIWPVAAREGSLFSVAAVIGLCVYVAWMVFGVSLAYKKPERISTAIFALAIGTSVVCIVGATALYGQLAVPFAAITGAWILYYLFSFQSGNFPASFYLSAALTCAILSAAATVFASLDWGVLAIFALLPPLIWIPFKSDSATWTRLLKSGITALIPVVAGILYTMHQSADSGYFG